MNAGAVIEVTDTLRSALQKLAAAFAAAGLDTPQFDARFLLLGVLDLGAEDLLCAPEMHVGPKAGALTAAAARRLAAEPVSRILGWREFYGRRFEVTPDVLDPRADTETIIDEVLAIADRLGGRSKPLRIADIGLGSGAILVTLLAELPAAHGTGTDVSAAAIACAERNAVRHGVAARMKTVETDVLAGVAGPFDIVVSNPPYIPTGEIEGLDRDVKGYDPLLALDGGQDGLDIYRNIYRAVSGLNDVTHVVLEVGAGQAQDVVNIFWNSGAGAGIWKARQREDLGGHIRCVTFERQSRRNS